MSDSLVAQLPGIEMAIGGSVHLLTDRWLSFCENRWSVSPERVQFSSRGAQALSIEASYFLDRHGRICRPPFSPGPYLPVILRCPEGDISLGLNQQWLEAGEAFARDMRDRGIAQRLSLPPSVADVRPWQWAGFQVNVFYTYMLPLPCDMSHTRSHVKRSIRKASQSGYTCDRVSSMEHVHECLIETQERQSFDLQISLDDLTHAQHALGSEILRAYVAYTPDGEPAAATVEIHEPGGTAVGWLAGTKSAHLNSGVTQLLTAYFLEDLAAHGAVTYDFAGANIPSVASIKLQWGAQLTPFYAIESTAVDSIARRARRYWRFQRARLTVSQDSSG